MLKKFIITAGTFSPFAFRVFSSLFRPPFRISLIFSQFIKIGLNSILIISLTGATMGLILTQQMLFALRQFGAVESLYMIVSKMISTELSPVVTALLLIAKNGSSITSEIGIMKTTNQLDVLESMNIDPIQYLAPSRILACTFMFPLLCAYSIIVGMAASLALIPIITEVDLAQSINFLIQRYDVHELLVGIIKSFFFGMFVALISLFHGFNSTRGAEGLSLATTEGVVMSSIAIILLDFILGKIYVEIF